MSRYQTWTLAILVALFAAIFALFDFRWLSAAFAGIAGLLAGLELGYSLAVDDYRGLDE